ncbi:MAG: hypothetical protein K2Y22_14180 [Candidatus Obscuribacterales bacterium]|nr:hypothetical protein [Candidatus Obscuribacterales bacterium]
MQTQAQPEALNPTVQSWKNMFVQTTCAILQWVTLLAQEDRFVDANGQPPLPLLTKEQLLNAANTLVHMPASGPETFNAMAGEDCPDIPWQRVILGEGDLSIVGAAHGTNFHWTFEFLLGVKESKEAQYECFLEAANQLLEKIYRMGSTTKINEAWSQYLQQTNCVEYKAMEF